MGVDRWIASFRRVVAAQQRLFDASRSIAERTVYEGVGEGGDHSLAIDRRCEDVVFGELDVLAGEGLSLTAVSEERGELAIGSGDLTGRAIIDPIDGSLNARRLLPSHSLSIAIAAGDSLADVELGYVYDFGAREEFVAVLGGATTVNGSELRAVGPDFGLEVVGMESAKPERVAEAARSLSGKAFRMRSVGSIAISLCYVAGGRFDGMLTGRPCRSVDLAAAQLIVREAGGALAIPGDGLAAGLGLAVRYHVIAALSEDMLEPLAQAQAAVDAMEARA